MINNPLSTLLDLVAFDQKTCSVRQEIQQLSDEIAALEQQQEQANFIVEEAKKHVATMRKETHERELRMKMINDQESQKKKYSSAISDYREYRALKEEIDALQHERQACEDDLLQLIHGLEVAQKDLEMQVVVHEEKSKQIQSAIAQYKEKINELENLINAREAERTQKEQSIPEEWREKYSIMRMRVADPVIPIVDESCSVCFQSLTTQDSIRIRKTLVQCQGCFRLLFTPDIIHAPSNEKAI